MTYTFFTPDKKCLKNGSSCYYDPHYIRDIIPVSWHFLKTRIYCRFINVALVLYQLFVTQVIWNYQITNLVLTSFQQGINCRFCVKIVIMQGDTYIIITVSCDITNLQNKQLKYWMFFALKLEKANETVLRVCNQTEINSKNILLIQLFIGLGKGMKNNYISTSMTACNMIKDRTVTF